MLKLNFYMLKLNFLNLLNSFLINYFITYSSISSVDNHFDIPLNLH